MACGGQLLQALGFEYACMVRLGHVSLAIGHVAASWPPRAEREKSLAYGARDKSMGGTYRMADAGVVCI